MTGGKLNHFRIINRLQVILENLLTESDCEVLGSGMLVRAGEASLVFPDVCVVCGEPATDADTRILLNPVLVVEVTSPSSIDRDRVLKRELYGAVASIQAYLVVDQHRALVELYTRSETGWFVQCFSDLGDEIALEALDCRLPLSDIYQNIDFESQTASNAN